jgi:hypothetical protein
MDLAVVNRELSALGPWGIAVGIVLTLVMQWLRSRFSGSRPAVDPGRPPSSPAVSPAFPDQFPLVWRLMQVLRLVPSGRPATVDDLPHELVVRLRKELQQVRAAQTARHTAALAELNAAE